MSEKRINEELSAVEATLASLKPVASGVDRDRVMFLAGRMSAIANAPLLQNRKTPWLWPCVAAVSLFLAIASSGTLFMRESATGEKQAAYAKLNTIQSAENISQPLWYEHVRIKTPVVKRPRPSSGRDSMSMDYLSLSMLVAEKGVDALPGPSWIPIGSDKVPRSGPVMRDDENVF
jgi:hypothetical protein